MRAATLPAGGAIPIVLVAYADGEFRQLQRVALQKLISACMDSAGFSYEPVAATAALPTPEMTIKRSFGVFEEAVAVSFGYVSPDEEDGPWEPVVPDDPAYLSALVGRGEAAESTVVDPLTGSPVGTLELRGGCVGAADLAFFGSQEARLRYTAVDYSLQQLGLSVVRSAQSDRPVVAALDSWSLCMRASGFDYGHPYEPNEVLWDEPRPQELEVNTAVADVACKRTSGLVDRLWEAALAGGAEADQSNLGLVQEWLAMTDELVARNSADIEVRPS